MNRLESRDQTEMLRYDIAVTRAELGDTLQALAARADFPARARASARRTMRRVRGQGAGADRGGHGGGEHARGGTSWSWRMVGSGVVALVGLAIVIRSRRA